MLLRDRSAKAGRFEDVNRAEMASRLLIECPDASAEGVNATLDSLLQLAPQRMPQKQRIKFYDQINALYKSAQENDVVALEDFADKQFNHPYNGGYFFGEHEVKALAFAVQYTLLKHGDKTRKIKGRGKTRLLYSGHPIEVALNYVSAFSATNKKLANPAERSAFKARYAAAPQLRTPHFADVIALLWHDLQEDEGLARDEIRFSYLNFVRHNIEEGEPGRFARAADRILKGIDDLTRTGASASTYLGERGLAGEMLRRGVRKNHMQKASDVIANLNEMDDVPGILAEAYWRARDAALGLLGEGGAIELLRRWRNLAVANFKQVEGLVSPLAGIGATFNTASRIKGLFRGFVLADTIGWYMHRRQDFDPYLIELKQRLVKAMLDRGDQIEFDLLNYHCRRFHMPPNLSRNNWRLHKHIYTNTSDWMPTRYYDTVFLQPYLGEKPKPFDLEAKMYIDWRLQRAAAEGTLSRLTESGRGSPFDGLIDGYYARLENKATEEETTRQILGNKTLQYMLTTAMLKIAEWLQRDPSARFNWAHGIRRAAGPDSYGHARNGAG